MLNLTFALYWYCLRYYIKINDLSIIFYAMATGVIQESAITSVQKMPFRRSKNVIPSLQKERCSSAVTGAVFRRCSSAVTNAIQAPLQALFKRRYRHHSGTVLPTFWRHFGSVISRSYSGVTPVRSTILVLLQALCDAALNIIDKRRRWPSSWGRSAASCHCRRYSGIQRAPFRRHFLVNRSARRRWNDDGSGSTAASHGVTPFWAL